MWYAGLIAFDYWEGGVLEALALCEVEISKGFLPSDWSMFQVSSLPAPLDQQAALASLFRVQGRLMFYLDSMWTLT